LEDFVVVDLEALEEVLGGDSFASDAGLFFFEDVVGDAVGVVGGEQFASSLSSRVTSARALAVSLSASDASPSRWLQRAVRTRSRSLSVS
jgi:hypothetical protein